MTSMEICLMLSIILPLVMSVKMTLLCFPMISMMSFLLTENPISLTVSSRISIIRSFSCCWICVMRPAFRCLRITMQNTGGDAGFSRNGFCQVCTGMISADGKQQFFSACFRVNIKNQLLGMRLILFFRFFQVSDSAAVPIQLQQLRLRHMTLQLSSVGYSWYNEIIL